MSEVNIEKVEVIAKPRQGKPLSIRVTVSWPIDEEDLSCTVNTKKENGDIVNSMMLDVTDQVMTFKTDIITERESYSVEVIGANLYQTRFFVPGAGMTMDPPSTGFIPIT